MWHIRNRDFVSLFNIDNYCEAAYSFHDKCLSVMATLWDHCHLVSGGPTGGNMMQQGGMGMNPTPSYTQPQYSQYSSGVRPGEHGWGGGGALIKMQFAIRMAWFALCSKIIQFWLSID